MRALALRPDDTILRLRRLLARARSRLAGDAGQERDGHERPDGAPPGLGEDPPSAIVSRIQHHDLSPGSAYRHAAPRAAIGRLAATLGLASDDLDAG
jgi:hypothetical protein